MLCKPQSTRKNIVACLESVTASHQSHLHASHTSAAAPHRSHVHASHTSSAAPVQSYVHISNKNAGAPDRNRIRIYTRTANIPKNLQKEFFDISPILLWKGKSLVNVVIKRETFTILPGLIIIHFFYHTRLTLIWFHMKNTHENAFFILGINTVYFYWFKCYENFQ